MLHAYFRRFDVMDTVENFWELNIASVNPWLWLSTVVAAPILQCNVHVCQQSWLTLLRKMMSLDVLSYMDSHVDVETRVNMLIRNC